MQITYENGSCVVDKLPPTVVYDTDLIQLAKTIAQKSLSKIEIEFRVNEYGIKEFSVNGREAHVYSGYNFAYCAKLLIDALEAAGYFA